MEKTQKKIIGRPKKEKTKAFVIHANVFEDEKERIEQKAKEMDISISKYCRNKILCDSIERIYKSLTDEEKDDLLDLILYNRHAIMNASNFLEIYNTDQYNIAQLSLKLNELKKRVD